MPIPAYMWLKDDGGADIKGSVDVQDRNGSIEIIGLSHGLSLPVDPANGKITGVNTSVPNVKTSSSQLNHIENVSLQYEKITWRYVDGNVQFSDAWNERSTAG
ncbi:type VI secretion system tube protein Hcp [Erwinia sp. S43]|uniref:type VI secretion system tube protein Hcp n=1 Tax=Erwinia sp. S43 TaxID=2769339 RepID=UPI00190B82E2|nr:type VI secretion system tube protein Hcp [Erwinia sp. S43]MBK0031196.1 type VI secretion system tube protein Hcp [Erwinia sp. S43]